MIKIDIVAPEEVLNNLLPYILNYFDKEPTGVFGGRDYDMLDKNGVELYGLHIRFED